MSLNVNDIIPITADVYSSLIQEKNGGDCMMLYIRFIMQMRMQNNTLTRSTDSFMMTAMGWGDARYRNAKNPLKELGLIKTTPIRGEDGCINEWGVEVMACTSDVSRTLESQSVARPVCGKRGTNIYNIYNTNNINNKENKKEEEVIKEKESSRVSIFL